MAGALEKPEDAEGWLRFHPDPLVRSAATLALGRAALEQLAMDRACGGDPRAAGELLYVLWAAQFGQRGDLQARFDNSDWTLLAIRAWELSYGFLGARQFLGGWIQSD